VSLAERRAAQIQSSQRDDREGDEGLDLCVHMEL
jgi:hypothetical protein